MRELIIGTPLQGVNETASVGAKELHPTDKGDKSRLGMMCRSTQTVVPLLFLAALVACATPQTTVPPPAITPQAVVIPSPSSLLTVAPVLPGPQLPPPAEELESYSLVRDHPAVAAATVNLAAASPASRPAALMHRARETFDAALKLRAERGEEFAFTGWSPDRERFIAYCDLALRDLDEILLAHPRSPEAPEAAFAVGYINDYPNLNEFDEALEAYRLTVERYPGTSWALQAGERIRVIEGIIDAGKGSPHDGGVSKPEPAR